MVSALVPEVPRDTSEVIGKENCKNTFNSFPLFPTCSQYWNLLQADYTAQYLN